MFLNDRHPKCHLLVSTLENTVWETLVCSWSGTQLCWPFLQVMTGWTGCGLEGKLRLLISCICLWALPRCETAGSTWSSVSTSPLRCVAVAPLSSSVMQSKPQFLLLWVCNPRSPTLLFLICIFAVCRSGQMSDCSLFCGFGVQANVHVGEDCNHQNSAWMRGPGFCCGQVCWAIWNDSPGSWLSNFWCVQEMSATFYINIFKLQVSEVLNCNNEWVKWMGCSANGQVAGVTGGICFLIKKPSLVCCNYYWCTAAWNINPILMAHEATVCGSLLVWMLGGKNWVPLG